MGWELRRILCAVDFSDCSVRALHHAEALARWMQAELTTLHVHPVPAPPLASVPFVGGEVVRPTLLSPADRTLLADALQQFVARQLAGGEADTRLQEAPDVPAAILEEAAATHADLLVLGTHGRTGLEQFVLGAVAEKVLRRALCTVMTVPPHAADPPAVPFRRVVCAIDFSPGSCRVLERARDLAAHAGARLTVLHVVELPADVPDIPQADLTAYRAARFDQAKRAMAAALDAARGTCDVGELLLAGRPGREIVRLATEQEADVVVLGVHGRGALDLAVFGSVTHHVVRHAPCPVLTVRTAP